MFNLELGNYEEVNSETKNATHVELGTQVNSKLGKQEEVNSKTKNVKLRTHK